MGVSPDITVSPVITVSPSVAVSPDVSVSPGGTTITITPPASTEFVAGVPKTLTGTSTGLVGATIQASFTATFDDIVGTSGVIGGDGSWSLNVIAAAGDVGKTTLYMREVGGSTARATLACTVLYWYLAEENIFAIYDGLDTGKLTLSGADVLAWADSSGNGHNLAHEGTTPLIVKDLNGRPAIGANSASGTGCLALATGNWVEAVAVCEYGNQTFSSYPGVVSGYSDKVVISGQDARPTWQVGFSLAWRGGISQPFQSAIATTVDPGVVDHVSNGAVTGVAVGSDRRASGRRWPGTIGDVVLFSAPLSAAARARVTRCMRERYAVDDVSVILDGNSLTSMSDQYPQYLQWVLAHPHLAWELSSRYNMVSCAVSGRTTAQMLANIAVPLALLEYNDNNVVVAWEIRNSLAGSQTGIQAVADLWTYCTAVRASGAKVIVINTLPATDLVGAKETERLTANSLLSANWATYADGHVDVAAVSELADPNDSLYYVDGVHLTSTGSTIVAELVATAISSIA